MGPGHLYRIFSHMDLRPPGYPSHPCQATREALVSVNNDHPPIKGCLPGPQPLALMVSSGHTTWYKRSHQMLHPLHELPSVGRTKSPQAHTFKAHRLTLL